MEDDIDIPSESTALIDISNSLNAALLILQDILHIILYKVHYLDKLIIV